MASSLDDDASHTSSQRGIERLNSHDTFSTVSVKNKEGGESLTKPSLSDYHESGEVIVKWTAHINDMIEKFDVLFEHSNNEDGR